MFWVDCVNHNPSKHELIELFVLKYICVDISRLVMAIDVTKFEDNQVNAIIIWTDDYLSAFQGGAIPYICQSLRQKWDSTTLQEPTGNSPLSYT